MNSTNDPPKRSSGLRRFGSFIFSLFFILLVIGTLATFFAKQFWIAEIFCHLRVQIAFALMICFFVSIIRKQAVQTVVALVFFIVNAAWIVPYFVPQLTKPVSKTVKVMSANVLTSNTEYSTFIQTVGEHNPDIVVVLEVNEKWKQEIAGQLSDDYPHQNIIAKDHNFGIGVLSKLPFENIASIISPATELISLDVRFVGPTGRPLRLIATHPFPPLSQYCFETRSQQLIELATLLDPAEDNIVAGDFNLTPWSPVFSEVLTAGDLKDASVGFGIAATWHAFPTFIGGIQIDHILISRSLTSINHTVSQAYGSDHRAVIVEIQLPIAPMKTPAANSTAASKSDTSQISVVYSSEYLIDLGGMEKMHPFDIRKYEKIYEALLNEKLITAGDVTQPSALSVDELKLIHTDDYLERLKVRANIAKYLEADALKLYPGSLDTAVLQPFRVASGGTLLAARKALMTGIGINIGGGYHHAKPDIGEGFCVYADVPIAIRKLQQEGLIKKAIVIDVDVHQGNGTAECLADDDSTFTFSMHQGDIYPIPKSNSDRDVEMQAGDGDKEFMAMLDNHLGEIIELADADICFIVGGCDTLEGDPLANLKMTEEGIGQRDAMIVDRCAKLDIPVVLTLSGGYSKNAWRSQYLSIKGLIQKYGLASE